LGIFEQLHLVFGLSRLNKGRQFRLCTETCVNFETNDKKLAEKDQSVFQSVNKDIDQCHLGAVEVEGLDQEMGEKFRSVEEKRADFFEVKVQLNCLGLTAGVDS
jgi:hypothetical protein